MAEGLALATSIIAVIQISDRVISLACQFIGKVRGAEREVAHIITTITSLKGFLEFLNTFIENDDSARQLPLLHKLSDPDGPLNTCTELLADIEDKLRPKRDYDGVLKAITWPLKWKDIGKALETIERLKTSIMLTMQGDTTRATLAIENTVNDMHRHSKDPEIRRWLTKVDPISNHIAARAKHEPRTGDWLILSHEFSYWLLPGRSLWLHGIPGAGKTVLCSTIIENVKSRCSSDVPCLYFYFDFSNPQKQILTNMLYSFLAQLSASSVPAEVQHLYESSGHGTRDATVPELMKTFLSIVDRTRQMYIVMDALDESSKSDRQSMFKFIKVILQTKDKLNVLVTSRKEPDIQDLLQHLMDYVVAMEDKRVDADIRLHVERCLHDDPDIAKWDVDLKSRIVASLTSGAHGM